MVSPIEDGGERIPREHGLAERLGYIRALVGGSVVRIMLEVTVVQDKDGAYHDFFKVLSAQSPEAYRGSSLDVDGWDDSGFSPGVFREGEDFDSMVKQEDALRRDGLRRPDSYG